jgi:hypothetical protein
VLTGTTVALAARNRLANRMRRRSVKIGQDLLGIWLVEIEFCRIGSKGRQLRRAFRDEPAAHAYVGQAVRLRATAPARIGDAHCCVRSSPTAQGLMRRAGIAMATAGAQVA